MLVERGAALRINLDEAILSLVYVFFIGWNFYLTPKLVHVQLMMRFIY